MEREEKGRERKGKRVEEFMGIKLRNGVFVGKRGGNSTPTTNWRIGFAQSDGSLLHVHDSTSFPIISTLSARKLGANLRGIQSHLHKAAKMTKGGSRLRHHHHHEKEKIVELPTMWAEPPDSPIDQPASASSLRRHIATSLFQHNLSVGNAHGLQPVTPASCSSLEVASYYQAVTPASSLDFKHKGEATYGMKTSVVLLKVLNKIWSLEEQHASNLSLVKELKGKLDCSRAQIKELVQEKKRDKREISDLMEQSKEGLAVRKHKEQDRIKDAVQSVRDELESERKLRKHSESLHRKLARELSVVKSSFSNSLKELERERKARILLENLCDEFAKGIRDYEQEVRSLKHKPDKDLINKESPDRLIVHISESWLDERMQMKLAEAQCDPAENNTIAEKMSFEIEAFLQAKQPVCSGNIDELTSRKPKRISLGRHSLESFHLNGNYEEDSTGSDFNYFESKRGLSGKERNGCSKQLDDHGQETVKLKRNIQPGEVPKNSDQSPDEVHNYQNSEITEITQGKQQSEKKRVEAHEFNSSHVLHTVTRSHSSSMKDRKFHHDRHCTEDSLDQTVSASHHQSIKQQRMSKTTTPEQEVRESSGEGPQVMRENSLKARLLEAKLESQKSRTRTSKSPL